MITHNTFLCSSLIAVTVSLTSWSSLSSQVFEFINPEFFPLTHFYHSRSTVVIRNENEQHKSQLTQTDDNICLGRGTEWGIRFISGWIVEPEIT